MNLIELFKQQVKSQPKTAALIHKGNLIDYQSLDQRSSQLAATLQLHGLKKGDVVLVLMPVSIELYVVILALLRAGIVILFPDPAAAKKTIAVAVNDLKPKAIIGPKYLSILRWFFKPLRQVPLLLSPKQSIQDAANWQDVACEANHLALITFTSGSTGRPKAIPRSHSFLRAQLEAVQTTLQSASGMIDLISLPVFVLANLAMGVINVIPDGDIRKPNKIDSSLIIKQIMSHKVQRLLVPPAFLQRLLQNPEIATVAPLIRQIFTGGGPVFPDFLQHLQTVFPQTKITIVYGSSEAEPIAEIEVNEITSADYEKMFSGCGLLVGRPISSIDLKLVEDEIWVKGDHVLVTYLNPADNVGRKIKDDTGAIWHRTGDAGYLDQFGRLWLLGRWDMRINGIYPFAVEVQARSIPGIHNAALVILNKQPVLVYEAKQAVSLPVISGISRIIRVTKIPLDRRHNSKVDYEKLRSLLSVD